jgi:hypothetical protein
MASLTVPRRTDIGCRQRLCACSRRTTAVLRVQKDTVVAFSILPVLPRDAAAPIG